VVDGCLVEKLFNDVSRINEVCVEVGTGVFDGRRVIALCMEVGTYVLDELYWAMEVSLVVGKGSSLEGLCVFAGAPLVKSTTKSRRRRCRDCMMGICCAAS